MQSGLFYCVNIPLATTPISQPANTTPHAANATAVVPLLLDMVDTGGDISGLTGDDNLADEFGHGVSVENMGVNGETAVLPLMGLGA